MEFDAVITPLARERFLSDYWNKSFVRMPGTAGRFTHLLGWDDLNAILEQHRLAPPRLKLFQNGVAVEPEQYFTPAMFGVPRLDGGRLAVCLAGGATLILDDVQELAPRVRALTQSFEEALHTDAYVNLYASWQSQNGFDLHWDAQDSIVIQLAGRKRWRVYRPTRLHPLPDDSEPPAKPTGEPLWDGMMEDGDALYIPRGWWHIAFPIHEPSLHLTVGTTPPHGMDFLGWMIARLRRHPDIRANLPALAGTDAQAAHLETLRKLLADGLGETTMAEFLREWEANIRPGPRIRLPGAPSAQHAALAQGSRVRLAALHRLSLVPIGANFEFRANGRMWGVPPDLVPALELLTDVRAFTIAELAEKLSGSGAAANLAKSIGVLARAGVVLIEHS